MRLKALLKTIDEMSDAELLERLRQVRSRREFEQPARAAAVARRNRKDSNKRLGRARSLLKGLAPEDQQALLDELLKEE